MLGVISFYLQKLRKYCSIHTCLYVCGGDVIKKTKKEAEKTRKLLLKSALEVFSRKGYSAATLNDIACEAGLTRGAVYWHFNNKADLYINMVDEYFCKMKNFITPPDSCKLTPLNRLEELIYKRLIILVEDEEIKKLVEVLRYKTEVKTESKLLEVQQQIDRYFWEETYRLVKRGIKAGEIRDDLDAAFLTTAILSHVNGIEDTWLFNTELFVLEEYLSGFIELFFQSIVRQ